MSKKTHVPIENIFPDAFSAVSGSWYNKLCPGCLNKDRTGIFVTQNTIHNSPGYTIDPFPESQQNRNHYDSRGGNVIKYLIMHYTESDFSSTMKIFTADQASDRISAHYIITEAEHSVSGRRVIIQGGQVIQVAQDTESAWHAGPSAWENDRNLNTTSVGIAHVQKGLMHNLVTEERIWSQFDEQQISASGTISQDIVTEYGIYPTHVLGHSDIAPNRKQDPGVLFPWAQLYSHYQVGAWLDQEEMETKEIISKYDPKEPCPDAANLSLFLKMLNVYGYNVSQELLDNPSIDKAKHIIRAFKSHFSANQKPELYTSPLDTTDMYWAWALNAKYHSDTDVELSGE